VSNTKLQVLADQTYNWDDYQVIMKHLWSIIALKEKEWRRIAKAIHVFDYLCKNGAPRIVQDVKDDLYKIRQYKDFEFKNSNGGIEGFELRDKVTALCELVNEPGKLQYEREFAKQTREKFMGISSVENLATNKDKKSSAAPASGTENKYGGFGSEDIAKFGYNNQEQFGTSCYDPYTKT